MSLFNFTPFEKVYNIIMDTVLNELYDLREEGITTVDGVPLNYFFDTHISKENRIHVEILFNIVCDYLEEVGNDNVYVKVFTQDEEGNMNVQENKIPEMDEDMIIPILITACFHTYVKNTNKENAYLRSSFYAQLCDMEEKDYETIRNFTQHMFELNVMDIVF